jgi:hypothetical protein
MLNRQQLELGLEKSTGRSKTPAGMSPRTRANWWFSRMRQVVEQGSECPWGRDKGMAVMVMKGRS